MRIVLDAAVSDQSSWRWLDRIMSRIEDGAHEWSIEDPDMLETSNWLNARQHFREIFRGAVKAGSYPRHGIHSRCVIVNPQPRGGELAPEPAWHYVDQPLKILVENRFTDGQLLNTIFAFLAPGPLEQLLQAKVYKLIEVDSPGGNGELKKLVADYAEAAYEKGIPVRVVVFTDSDGRFPGDIHRGAQAVSDVCDEHLIPCCILSKRAIENYIPDEVLSAWAPKFLRAQVAALLRLTPQQRDHFPIKSGKDFSKLTTAEQSLYATVSSGDQKALAQGLGDHIVATLKTHKDLLSKEVLERRDHTGDLSRLIQMLANEI